MGNDMFNDEQLAHMEIVQKETEDAVGFWKERALKAEAALDAAERERDEAIRTVKALTPAANYCLEYKPLLLKAEYERDRAVRVLREIATYGWYAKGAKVARAYFSAKEGR